ncbi:MAG: hypothetical protein ACT4OI_01080 [Methanobacteriota archaeon]
MSFSTIETGLGLHLGILGLIFAAGLPTTASGQPTGFALGIVAWGAGFVVLASAWYDAKRGL